MCAAGNWSLVIIPRNFHIRSEVSRLFHQYYVLSPSRTAHQLLVKDGILLLFRSLLCSLQLFPAVVLLEGRVGEKEPCLFYSE